MDIRTLRLNASDNVLVALENIPSGHVLEDDNVIARDSIPAGHKIAARDIGSGGEIRKYGQPIGVASTAIRQGEHVHTHNVAVADMRQPWSPQTVDPVANAVHVSDTFQGIRRRDGRVATRNYLAVIASVNCSATVVRKAVEQAERSMHDFPNVDGIVPITHAQGCGMGSDVEGMQQLQRTLCGYCDHANFAGVIVVGLGCEANSISAMLAQGGLETSDTLRYLTIQEVGGSRAAVDRIREVVSEMLPAANDVEREPVPASEIRLGLECGGSDGYSGLSANPALGLAVDEIVRQGGTAILSETPEVFGAEHLLLRRSASADVTSSFLGLMSWWEQYVNSHGGKMDNNPTQGNKSGGLTTIYEKSIGAVAKGGSTSLRAVYRYAEKITERGLVFMDSPGYDPMSITGQVASGANLVGFTTGRGAVFGCKPVPTIKIASNSAMFNRMQDDMDINCGRIIDGESSVEEMGREIYETILRVASGKLSRSEEFGFGDNEFVPWVIGANM